LEGSLTALRLYAARRASLRELRDAENAPNAAELAAHAGFAAAAPLFEGPRRRDAIEGALALLARDRSLHTRVLLQAGIGAVLAVSLATAGSGSARFLALVAGFLALPIWIVALGAPDAVAAVFLATPISGAPARETQNARLLAALALFLGCGAEPAAAKRIAEDFVGAPLSDDVVARAIASPAFAGKVVLREESEGALLRAALRLERTAAVRARLLFLGVMTVALGVAFQPYVQDALHPERRPKPQPTRVDEEERPGMLMLTTGGTGAR